MLITTCFQISYSQSESSQVLKLSDIADSEVKRTKGICHTWFTGWHFSLSLPVEDFRFLKLHSKATSAPKSRSATLWSNALTPKYTLLSCLRMCKFPGNELLVIHGRKKIHDSRKSWIEPLLFHFWSQEIYGGHLSETTLLWDLQFIHKTATAQIAAGIFY